MVMGTTVVVSSVGVGDMVGGVMGVEMEGRSGVGVLDDIGL